MRQARPSHSLVVVATLALTSCAHDAPLPPPPPAPVLAEIAPVPEPPAGPEPMSDGPAILSSFCTPIWAVHEDGGRRIACSAHGPYYASSAFTGGEILEHRGDPLEVCELASVTHGAFTHAGAKQVLVAFAECNVRGKGTASPFVVLLEETEPGKFRSVSYQPELGIEHCERTEHDGRQILYCELKTRMPNLGSSTTYGVVDFGHPSRHLGVVATLMRHELNCAYFQTTGQNTMTRGYVWMRTPTFHTDHGKLVIEVERTYAPRSPALDGQLGAECQKNPETDGLAVLPPPQKHSLTIEPKGDTYLPAPASKTLLDQWGRELNDFRLRGTWPAIWLAGKK